MASYHPRRPARKSRDYNSMFYRVLLGIRIIILLEISCDSRDSRQDSKDSDKILRFQRDSCNCRRDSESCRTPRFRDTDNPTTIYGHSGKLCHMLSVTLTIQRPYIVDFGYHREFSCHTRTCKASGSFFVVYSRKMTIQRNSR